VWILRCEIDFFPIIYTQDGILNDVVIWLIGDLEGGEGLLACLFVVGVEWMKRG
jgi:hypothetical protein